MVKPRGAQMVWADISLLTMLARTLCIIVFTGASRVQARGCQELEVREKLFDLIAAILGHEFLRLPQPYVWFPNEAFPTI